MSAPKPKSRRSWLFHFFCWSVVVAVILGPEEMVALTFVYDVLLVAVVVMKCQGVRSIPAVTSYERRSVATILIALNALLLGAAVF
jgi:hypothetical protein